MNHIACDRNEDVSIVQLLSAHSFLYSILLCKSFPTTSCLLYKASFLRKPFPSHFLTANPCLPSLYIYIHNTPLVQTTSQTRSKHSLLQDVQKHPSGGCPSSALLPCFLCSEGAWLCCKFSTRYRRCS